MKLEAGGVARARMPIVMITLVILAVIVTAAVAWMDPAYDPLKKPRAGLLGDVDTLRIAELSLFDFEEAFVPCGSSQAAHAAVIAQDASWRADPCWDRLGFRPVGEQGAFWAEAAGGELVVHGIADFNRDGELLQVLATRDSPARVLSED